MEHPRESCSSQSARRALDPEIDRLYKRPESASFDERLLAVLCSLDENVKRIADALDPPPPDLENFHTVKIAAATMAMSPAKTTQKPDQARVRWTLLSLGLEPLLNRWAPPGGFFATQSPRCALTYTAVPADRRKASSRNGWIAHR